MDNVCRLCLSEEAFLDIFKHNLEFFKAMRLCTELQMKPDDGLPRMICATCKSFIESVTLFKHKCESSDRYLRTKLNSIGIKQEVDEKDFNVDPINNCDNSYLYPEISMTVVSKVEIETSEMVSLAATENKIDPPHTNETAFGSIRYKKQSQRNKRKESNVEKNEKKLSPKRNRVRQKISDRIKTSKAESFQCKICNTSFKAKKYLRIHNKKYTDCHLRKKSVPEKVIQSNPKKDGGQTSSYVKNFNNFCPFCGLHFELLTRWEEHLRTHKSKPLECDVCNKGYKTRRHLVAHIERHADKRDCQCDLCGGLFRTLHDVQRHILWVHNYTMAECKICGRLVKSTGMKIHMLTHNTEKNYECDICHRKFLSKPIIAVHIRTHTGEKPFVCKFCPLRFATRRTTKDHERLHTGERPHICPVCNLSFIQLSNMKSHFRNNHKGVEFVYQRKKSSSKCDTTNVT